MPKAVKATTTAISRELRLSFGRECISPNGNPINNCTKFGAISMRLSMMPFQACPSTSLRIELSDASTGDFGWTA